MSDVAMVQGAVDRTAGGNGQDQREEPDVQTKDVYGLLTLGGVEVALPLEALREVAPCPEELAPLPAPCEALLGALQLRELVVPVVDLRAQLGLPTDTDGVRDGQVVVLIADGERFVGVLADDVRGITRVPSAELRAVRAEGGPLLLTHTFRRAEHVVSVLDAGAVLTMPGLPTIEDVAVRAHTAGAGGSTAAGARRKLTLLRCGGYVLGLEVEHVHTTLPAAETRPSVLSSSVCRGVIGYRDVEVPVVDPLALLGLGQLGDEPAGANMVLQFEEGYVVLALTEFVDLVELAEDAVMPLAGFALQRPELLSGVAELEGRGMVFVLDGERLRAEPDLLALAALNAEGETGETGETAARAERPTVRGDDAADDDEAAHTTGPAYLTYSAGVDLASPLEQVAEILPYPTVITDTAIGGAVLGLIVHRQTAVPLICMRTLLRQPRVTHTQRSCVLLVRVGDHQVAFAVDGLHEVDTLSWQDPEATGSSTGTYDAEVLRRSPLVQIGDSSKLLPDVDLERLAAEVAGASV